MARPKKENTLPGALAESIKSSIHSLEVQINLLKQAIGAAPAAEEEEATEPPAKTGKRGKAKSEDAEEEEFDLDGGEEEEEESDADSDEEEEQEEEESDDGEEEEEEAATLEDVLRALQKFAKKGKKQQEQAKKLLVGFKVKSARELDKKHYQKFLDKLEALS